MFSCICCFSTYVVSIDAYWILRTGIGVRLLPDPTRYGTWLVQTVNGMCPRPQARPPVSALTHDSLRFTAESVTVVAHEGPSHRYSNLPRPLRGDRATASRASTARLYRLARLTTRHDRPSTPVVRSGSIWHERSTTSSQPRRCT
jgi:hypothetical protein